MAMAWAVAPQIACFMPDEMLTQAEKDCCKGMMRDCSGANMAHECCKTVGRAEVGTPAKASRSLAPSFEAAVGTLDVASSLLPAGSHTVSLRNNHAPPLDSAASFLILRI